MCRGYEGHSRLYFHGLQDGVVMPSRSVLMFYALRDAGNEDVILVTYPNFGHGCWDEAFSTAGLFGWMFGKRKLSFPVLQD